MRAMSIRTQPRGYRSGGGGPIASGSTFSPFRTANFSSLTTGGSPVSSTVGIDTTNGADSVVDTLNVAISGKSLKCNIASGATHMGGAFEFQTIANGGVVLLNDEMWVQWYTYLPTTWTISTGDGGMKFFRPRAYISGGIPQGSNTVQLWGAGPAPSGMRTECEQAPDPTDTQFFTPSGGWTNNFWKTECYCKMGQSDGAMRTWVNNTLVGEVLNCNTRGGTSFLTWAAYFLDFYNNTAPQSQTMWLSNFVVGLGSFSLPSNTDAAGNRFIGTYP